MNFQIQWRLFPDLLKNFMQEVVLKQILSQEDIVLLQDVKNVITVFSKTNCTKNLFLHSYNCFQKNFFRITIYKQTIFYEQSSVNFLKTN